MRTLRFVKSREWDGWYVATRKLHEQGSSLSNKFDELVSLHGFGSGEEDMHTIEEEFTTSVHFETAMVKPLVSPPHVFSRWAKPLPFRQRQTLRKARKGDMSQLGIIRPIVCNRRHSVMCLA